MNRYTRVALLFGGFGGLLCSLWFLGVHFSGSNPYYSFPQKLIIVLQAAIVYFSIRYFRAKSGEESFSFAEGIFCGLAVALVVAVTSSGFIYVYSSFIEPEIVTEHVAELKNYLISNQAQLISQSSKEAFEGNLKNVDEVNAFTLAIDDFIWKIVRGGMFSILVSLTLRRQKQ